MINDSPKKRAIETDWKMALGYWGQRGSEIGPSQGKWRCIMIITTKRCFSSPLMLQERWAVTGNDAAAGLLYYALF